MNKKEKFALFLGMLSGDGCLSIKHNGEGYRIYPIDFCNTNKELVVLFDQLFFELFGLRANLTSRKREGRKKIWQFLKYSKKTVEELKSIGFPEGVKRDVLRILNIIKNGSKKEKLAFILGILITDGSIKKNNYIMWHMGGKLFLEDLSKLIEVIFNIKRPIKEFIQRGKYKSYQLTLNSKEGTILLSEMPTWDNGTPAALRAVFLRDFPVRFRASALQEKH